MSAEPDDDQATTVRLTADRHEWLRRQSFDRRVSMRQVIEDAIDLARAHNGPPPPAVPGARRRQPAAVERRPGQLFRDPL